ncbi:iron-sulfur cluster assembly scaffold protein [Halocynthiibacter styelae]|uniref:Iron-sulfur cluster assembly scaffold protein n=1 Tax=Halocynthiibacter styelae TaxID=2761955 RepID=A0A8J7IVH2_9RHOB|nr:iron-sulfur cluster assembly scaffold protein [Paenihalocynthiibacter styelae]MBI1492310.1 iron-sulfur cluster assembly scaffold protein [Paenihalocynthiibacter styelae]
MSADSDLINLYSGRILALAADIPALGKLEDADIEVKKRSPLCGSTVTVGVNFDGDVISEFRQDVKACALGQAAASVIGGSVVGRNQDEIRILRDQLSAMLKSDGPAPSAPFDGLESLRPAKDFKNRHASILLVADALNEAFDTRP